VSRLPLFALSLALACGPAREEAAPVSAPEPASASELVARAEVLSELYTPATQKEAHALLERAQALEPDNAEVWLAWGRFMRSSPPVGDEPFAGIGGQEEGEDARGERALACLERARALDPENAEVLVELSRHLFTMGRRKRADKLMAQLLERQPDHVGALLRRGETLVSLGRSDQAVAPLERCIARAREEGDLLTAFQAEGALGLAYAQQGRSAEAEALLVRAAADLDAHSAAHPGRTTVNCPHMSLVRLYRLSGRRSQVAEHATRAADLRIWIPKLQYLAARELLEEGDVEGARVYLDRGLARDSAEKVDPVRADLQRRLEQLEQPTGDAGGALAAALRLADLYRFDLAVARLDGEADLADCVDCQVLRGFVALLEGQPESARAHFEVVLGRQPGHLGARVGLGHLALEGGEHSTALAAFEEALVQLAGEGSLAGEGMQWMVRKMALLGVAWIHVAKGRNQRASASFAQVLAQRPDDIQALLGQGNALNGLGQPALAGEHFQRVLYLVPDQPQALAGLGTALLNQGEHELAAAVFRGAQAVSPTAHSCPYEGLGLAYLAQGRSGEAREQFELAIAADPRSDYRKYDELAALYLEEGNLEEAERLLRRSLENHPQGERARAMLEELESQRQPERKAAAQEPP